MGSTFAENEEITAWAPDENDEVFDSDNGGVPEFSLIGLILMLVVVALGVAFIIKKKKK